jgi:hypothetical protein
MTDAFDIAREKDYAAQANVDAAMEKLDECQDKAGDRDQRLIPLDEQHFFDPQTKQVLFKAGASYRNLGHDAHFEAVAARIIEEEADAKGYTALPGGLYWDKANRSLYVKNGGHYVFYGPAGARPPSTIL